MNLTVEKALESVHGQSKSMIRLAESVERMDLVEEIASVQENLTGILSVVEDLNMCQESLGVNGYTEEWFAMVNEGNKFVALTNLEMPKFFGTEETKRVACEGAIIDTVTVWLKKAWEFLKKLYELVMKGCRMLLQYWGVTPKVTVVQRVFDNIGKRLEEMQTFEVEIPDIFKVFKYSENLYVFCEKLYNKQDDDKRLTDKGIFFSFINAGEDTGTLQQDVMTRLVGVAQSVGVQTDSLDNTGFAIDSTGVKFVDVKSIPSITVNIADKKEFDQLVKNNSMVLALFDKIKNQVAILLNLLQKNERAMQDEWMSVKANTPDDAARIRTAQARYTRAKTLLATMQLCNGQYMNYNQAFRNYLIRLDQAVRSMTKQP